MLAWRAAVLRIPRSLLAAVLAVRLLDESNAFLLPGTFESLRVDIGLSYSQASAAFLAIAVGAVAGTGTVVIADYRSRRVICSLGAVACGLSLLVIGVATSAAAILGGAILLGAASTAMVDTAEIVLAELVPDEDRLAHRLTTQNLLGSIGDLAGPALVVGALGLGLSWRWCFFVGAVLVTVYGLWVATLPFPAPHRTEATPTIRAGVASVLRDPVVWLAGLVSLLLGPLDEPLLAFVIAHLEHARGVSAAGATLVATCSVVGAFVGYATLRLRAGRLSSDAVGLAGATTGLLVAPEALTAAVASLLVGVFLVRGWIDLQARVLTLRPGQTGTVKAVITVIEAVGWTLPLLAGAIADRLDVTAGLATYAVIASALAVAATALRHVADRRRGRPASGEAYAQFEMGNGLSARSLR